MNGLLIKKPWIDLILSGRKTWEIRGTRTRVRGRIGLIQSGSGRVVGACDLTDVVGPLSMADLKRNYRRIGIPLSQLPKTPPYSTTYAWVLENPKRYRRPRPYEHPRGAVTWVRL